MFLFHKTILSALLLCASVPVLAASKGSVVNPGHISQGQLEQRLSGSESANPDDTAQSNNMAATHAPRKVLNFA